MQLVSAGLSIVGGFVQGNAAGKAGNQNKAALYGQAIEEENAGNAQAIRIRDQSRKAIGQQAAAQWSNGFTGDSGSAIDALTESQVNATLDMMQVRRDAAMKARSMRAEGDMRQQQGSYAKTAAIIGGFADAATKVSDWASAAAGGG